MKKLNTIIGFLILGIMLADITLSPVFGGEIYSYVNSNGVRVYTDKVPKRRKITRPTVKVHKLTNQRANTDTVKIFKFVDSTGVIHLTDKPKHSNYKLIYKSAAAIPPFSSKLKRGSTALIHRKYQNYKALVQDVATNIHLEPALLHAMIQTESAYNPKAVSPKGAVGLMQLMPATARRFGVIDRTDATSNVYGGARYLRYLLKMFNNNKKLALAAYNAGEKAVKRYGNKIPPYRETKYYVKKVLRLYNAHQKGM
jgi:soluble lytic murein transglycosylase-like protein